MPKGILSISEKSSFPFAQEEPPRQPVESLVVEDGEGTPHDLTGFLDPEGNLISDFPHPDTGPVPAHARDSMEPCWSSSADLARAHGVHLGMEFDRDIAYAD